MDALNKAELEQLGGATHIFHAIDKGHRRPNGMLISDLQATKMLNQRGRWTAELPLAVGAQVMLVTNWKDTGFVNGSTGRVTDFVTVKQATQMGAFIHTDTREAVEKSNGRYFERAHLGQDGVEDPAQATAEDTELWPLVEFKVHGSTTNATRLAMVPRMTLTLEGPDGNLEATREQVPLILAW